MSAVVERADPVRDLGCWIAGHRGIYATSSLVRKAAEWGYPLNEDDHRALDAYDAAVEEIQLGDGMVNTDDWVVELCDWAEDWLNEHVAPEGHAFGWCDGEFFLWTDEEWAADL